MFNPDHHAVRLSLKTILIILLLILGSSKVSTQTWQLTPDTDNTEFFVNLENEQHKYLDSLFADKTGTKRSFISGKNYSPYYTLSNHKPILFYGKERTASLISGGKLFRNIDLQYDTYLDILIYENKGLIFNSLAGLIALNSDYVNRFDLYFENDTLSFCYFSPAIDPAFNLEPGFYELVYDGRCKYMVKHKSTRSKVNGIEDYWYDPEGFVKVGEQYVKISSLRQFVHLFGSASVNIRQFIAKKNIRIRDAGKNQITDILRFYESIENKSL